MFQKIKNIKNIVVISVSAFVLFIVGALIFLIISNVRLSKKIDSMYGGSYCECESEW